MYEDTVQHATVTVRSYIGKQRVELKCVLERSTGGAIISLSLCLPEFIVGDSYLRRHGVSSMFVLFGYPNKQ